MEASQHLGEAVQGDLAIKANGIGDIAIYERGELSFGSDGQAEKIYTEEDDEARKVDALTKPDADALELARTEAELALTEQQAVVIQPEVNPETADLNKTEDHTAKDVYPWLDIDWATADVDEAQNYLDGALWNLRYYSNYSPVIDLDVHEPEVSSVIGLDVYEPEDYKAIRNSITVRVYVSLLDQWETLRWIPFLSVKSDDMDMLTVSYACVRPGKGINGDIEGWAQIANSADSNYSKRDYDKLGIEYTRMGWDKQEFILPWETLDIPGATADGVATPGYLTVWMDLE